MQFDRRALEKKLKRETMLSQEQIKKAINSLIIVINYKGEKNSSSKEKKQFQKAYNILISFSINKILSHFGIII